MSSVLIVEDVEASEGDLLLCEADLPANFAGMKHPEDGMLRDTPIPPEFIRHKRPHHHRLLLRVSFKLESSGNYVPFTFVCDTGAPGSFYLAPFADKILAEGGRHKEDDASNTFMTVLNRPAATQETPRNHQPGNSIGLSLIEKLGLVVEKGTFRFIETFDYF